MDGTREEKLAAIKKAIGLPPDLELAGWGIERKFNAPTMLTITFRRELTPEESDAASWIMEGEWQS